MIFRKPNRLQGFDYSSAAYYFITICVERGILGTSSENGIILNTNGVIVKECWEDLVSKFTNLELDEFIIMPDHFHGILVLINPEIITISKVVQSFKISSAKKIFNRSSKEFKWQRSFNDRIIRNESELFNKRRYIRYNYLKVNANKLM